MIYFPSPGYSAFGGPASPRGEAGDLGRGGANFITSPSGEVAVRVCELAGEGI